MADKTINIYERDLKTLATPTTPTRQTTLTYHGRQTKTSLAALAAETVAHEKSTERHSAYTPCTHHMHLTD